MATRSAGFPNGPRVRDGDGWAVGWLVGWLKGALYATPYYYCNYSYIHGLNFDLGIVLNVLPSRRLCLSNSAQQKGFSGANSKASLSVILFYILKQAQLLADPFQFGSAFIDP